MSSIKFKIEIILITIFLLLINQTKTYRILGLFPHPGISHFHFFHPIMQGLADVGHNVTVVSHFPNKNKTINYMDLQLPVTDSFVNVIDLAWFSNRHPFTHFNDFFMISDWGIRSCENALNSSAIDQVLNEKQPYDLIIMEQFNSDCMMGIAWKLQLPVIGLSSCAIMSWHYNAIGLPTIPSYIPLVLMGYSDKMTFAQRFANWISVHGLEIMYRLYTQRHTDRLLKEKFGQDIPHIAELAKRTNLMFVNQHYSLSGAKPLSPAAIELGGIHIKEPKPIDEDIESILNSADHGVIFISWGSMIRANSLPIEKRNALLDAFSTLKQKILWKWENDTIENKPKNVFTRTWLPQREILCHPKVHVFLSHGGLLGASEAAYCGVPVIVTPMFGDQFINAAALIDRGMGVELKYEAIDKENVLRAIRKALDPQTQENAKKVSYSFRNRQNEPLETAIWWTEHTIKTGGAQLTKSHSTFMSIIEYHLLDVYLLVILIVGIVTYSWIILIRLCLARKKVVEKIKWQ